MHDDDNPRRVLTNAEADDRDQEGILAHLIAEHPDQLTIEELAREMRRKEDTRTIPDWLDRGVRDLVGIGLLHRCGDTIRPTRAALRFNYLFFDRDEAKTRELTHTPAAARRPGRRPQGGLRSRSIMDGFASCLGLREAAEERPTWQRLLGRRGAASRRP